MNRKDWFLGECDHCEGSGDGAACECCDHRPECDRCAGSGEVAVSSPFTDRLVRLYGEPRELRIRGRRFGLWQAGWALACGFDRQLGEVRYWGAGVEVYQVAQGIRAPYQEPVKAFEWLVANFPDWSPVQPAVTTVQLHAAVLAAGFKVESRR